MILPDGQDIRIFPSENKIRILMNSLNLQKGKAMNIQAEKLELVRLILDTDNPSVLASIKRIFSNSNKVDFWDNLSNYQKEEILKGIEEIEKGETVDYGEFIKKHQ
ncbi:MAG: hypothetical protein M0Q38_02525 [Bacteroidales bacterium]|jgi:hypothetical protein|nr:hypothetical protein [Bacteroidales bacterium]